MSISLAGNLEIGIESYGYNVSIFENRELFFNLIKKVIGFENVSYDKPSNKGGNITAGRGTFNISEINKKPKFSLEYYDCTGIICKGISKKTGEDISFMSHQDPLKVLYSHSNEFLEALIFRLQEMLTTCYEGSINIGLFGGSIHCREAIPSDYSDIVIIVRKIVQDILKQDLKIIVGPNNPDDNSLGDDDISANFAYDIESGLFLANKPKQVTELSNNGFNSKNLDNYLGKFKK